MLKTDRDKTSLLGERAKQLIPGNRGVLSEFQIYIGIVLWSFLHQGKVLFDPS